MTTKRLDSLLGNGEKWTRKGRKTAFAGSPGPSPEKPEGAHRESCNSAKFSMLAANKSPQMSVDFWSLILSEWWSI